MNKSLKKILKFLLFLILVPAVINTWIIAVAKYKRRKSKANSKYFSWKHGKVYYTTKGTGKPLLLLHGIGTGASSFEFRKNFEELSKSHKVYALDFLGFGKSDSPAMTYTGFLYVQLIIDFIEKVIKERTHVICSSHSAAYAIMATHLHPDLIEKMILICPVGISQNQNFPNKKDKLLKDLFHSPILGTLMYNFLASSYSIKHFLQKQIYFNPIYATDYVTEQYYISAHHSGVNSKYAPASFLGNYLNLPIKSAFSALNNEIFILWGRDCDINAIENLDEFLFLQPKAKVEIFEESKLLPHEEHAEIFNTLAKEFLY